MNLFKSILVILCLVSVFVGADAAYAASCGCQTCPVPLEPANRKLKDQPQSGQCEIDSSGQTSSKQPLFPGCPELLQCYYDYTGFGAPTASINLGDSYYTGAINKRDIEVVNGRLHDTISALGMTFKMNPDFIEELTDPDNPTTDWAVQFDSVSLGSVIGSPSMMASGFNSGIDGGVSRGFPYAGSTRFFLWDAGIVDSVRASGGFRVVGDDTLGVYRIDAAGYDGTGWDFESKPVGYTIEEVDLASEPYRCYTQIYKPSASDGITLMKLTRGAEYIRVFYKSNGKVDALGAWPSGYLVKLEDGDGGGYTVYQGYSTEDYGDAFAYNDKATPAGNIIYRSSSPDNGGGSSGANEDGISSTTTAAYASGEIIEASVRKSFIEYYTEDDVQALGIDPINVGKVYREISPEVAAVLIATYGNEFINGLPSEALMAEYATKQYSYYGFDDAGGQPGQIKSIKNSCSSCTSSSGAKTVSHVYVNDKVVASDDAYYVMQGETLTVDSFTDALLANDAGVLISNKGLEVEYSSDASIITPTDESVEDPSYPDAEDIVTYHGRFTYEPDSSFSGKQVFHYRATDGVFYSDLATVTLNVVPMADREVHWPLDTWNGSVTPDDDSDDSRPGTCVGSVGFSSQAQAGMAAEFDQDQTQDYIEFDFDTDGDGISDDDFLTGSSAFTVACWIKAASTDNNKVIVRGGVDPDEFCIRFIDDYENGTRTNAIWAGFTLSPDGIGDDVVINVVSSSGKQTTEWTHVAVTWASGQSAKLYIDGVEDTGAYVSATPVGDYTLACSTEASLSLAKGFNGISDSWVGYIDDFRLYSKVLNDDEVDVVANWVNIQSDPAASVGSFGTKQWVYYRSEDERASASDAGIKTTYYYNIYDQLIHLQVQVFDDQGQECLSQQQHTHYEYDAVSGLVVKEYTPSIWDFSTNAFAINADTGKFSFYDEDNNVDDAYIKQSQGIVKLYEYTDEGYISVEKYQVGRDEELDDDPVTLTEYSYYTGYGPFGVLRSVKRYPDGISGTVEEIEYVYDEDGDGELLESGDIISDYPFVPKQRESRRYLGSQTYISDMQHYTATDAKITAETREEDGIATTYSYDYDSGRRQVSSVVRTIGSTEIERTDYYYIPDSIGMEILDVFGTYVAKEVSSTGQCKYFYKQIVPTTAGPEYASDYADFGSYICEEREYTHIDSSGNVTGPVHVTISTISGQTLSERTYDIPVQSVSATNDENPFAAQTLASLDDEDVLSRSDYVYFSTATSGQETLITHAFGKPIAVREYTTYDATGGVDNTVFVETKYTYAADGRLESIEQPGGAITVNTKQFLVYDGNYYWDERTYTCVNESNVWEAVDVVHSTLSDISGRVIYEISGLLTGSLSSEGPIGNESLTILTKTKNVYDGWDRLVATQVWHDDMAAYEQSEYYYDNLGRVVRQEAMLGDITVTEYDAAGRPVETYQGTDISNLELTSSADFNTEVVGSDTIVSHYVASSSKLDVNLTGTLAYTDTLYSPPAHMEGVNLASITVDTATHVFTCSIFDDAGRTIEQSSYYIETLPASWDDYIGAQAGEVLLSKMSYVYNSTSGRLESTHVYEVDSGIAGNSLDTFYYYNTSGQLCKQTNPSGGYTKYVYDAAGRQVGRYLCSEEGSDTDPATLTDDIVIEQELAYYHPATGFSIISEYYTRNHDATETGALTESNSQVQLQVNWYDATQRVVANAFYGNNAGEAILDGYWGQSVLLDPTTYEFDGVSGSSYSSANLTRGDANYLLTTYEYDFWARGGLQSTVDAEGVVTKSFDNAHGQPLYLVENADDFDPLDDSTAGDSADHTRDRVTKYLYDDFGRLASMTALDANGDGSITSGDSQTTRYVYTNEIAVEIDDFCVIPSHDLLAAVIYPDSDDTITPTGFDDGTDGDYDRVEFTYYANGQMATRKDQRGITHTYTYDDAGRLAGDGLSSVPVGYIKAFETTYDRLGRQETISAIDSNDGILSQVKNHYDGFGNLISQQQEHAGVVDEYSPELEYAYSSNSRLNSITYPDGTVFTYSYGSGGISDAISRPEAIMEGANSIVSYDYNGSSQIVRKTYAKPDIRLDYYAKLNNGSIDNSSPYSGFDRFGRIQNQLWYNNASAASGTHSALFDIQYAYDSASNKLYADRKIYPSHSQVYSYDNLNRLIGFEAGKINTTGSTATIEDYWQLRKQGWTLDQLGNQKAVEDFGRSDWYTGTFNQANEYASENGSRTVAGDAKPYILDDDFSSDATEANYEKIGALDGFDIDSTSSDAFVFTTVAADTLESYTESEDRAIVLIGEAMGPARPISSVKLPRVYDGDYAGIVFGYTSPNDYWMYVAEVDIDDYDMCLYRLYHVQDGDKGSPVWTQAVFRLFSTSTYYALDMHATARSLALSYEFSDGFPAGRYGLVTNVSGVEFTEFKIADNAISADLLGRWLSNGDQICVEEVDFGSGTTQKLKIPGSTYDIEDRSSPILLDTVKADRFRATFSYINSVAPRDIFFIFAASDMDDYSQVGIHYGGSTVSALRVDDGQPATPIGGTCTAANAPSISAGDTMWVRVEGHAAGPFTYWTVKAINKSSAPTDSEWNATGIWYQSSNLSFNSVDKGRVGFMQGSDGYVDDFELCIWDSATADWALAAVEDFDFDSAANAHKLTPLHDANGNLIYDGSYIYSYDGWDRLASVSLALPDDSISPADSDTDPDAGPVIATLRYDATGRRISKTITNSADWNTVEHYYYDNWCLAEVRGSGTSMVSQYVWGLGYVDELCLIRHNGVPFDFYALQDSNYNVLGVVQCDWSPTSHDYRLAERYEYTPYGQRTVYSHSVLTADINGDGRVDAVDSNIVSANSGTSGDFGDGDVDGDGFVESIDDGIFVAKQIGCIASNDDPLVQIPSLNTQYILGSTVALCPFGHQGLMFDKEFGQYYNRARYLHPVFGRFTQRDPLNQNEAGGGYQDGMNLYQYEWSSPVNVLDFEGTRAECPLGWTEVSRPSADPVVHNNSFETTPDGVFRIRGTTEEEWIDAKFPRGRLGCGSGGSFSFSASMSESVSITVGCGVIQGSVGFSAGGSTTVTEDVPAVPCYEHMGIALVLKRTYTQKKYLGRMWSYGGRITYTEKLKEHLSGTVYTQMGILVCQKQCAP